MKAVNKITTWNFIFFIGISFYSMGATLVESLVNYPIWHIIGHSDTWTTYHIALGEKIIPVLAVPVLLLQLIANVLLFFFRPFLIPKWTVWTTLLLLLIVIISSAFIQIPIQFKLNEGYSSELMDTLISSDLFFRVAVGVVRNCLVVYMMYCLLKRVNLSNNYYQFQDQNGYITHTKKQGYQAGRL
jgi:hypothetical protein